MDRERIVRESERAAIERWFPPSPLGPLFDPGDGNLLPIPADSAPAWKAEAFARIDAWIAETRTEKREHMVLLFLWTIGLFAIVALVGLPTGTSLMIGTALGAFVLHAWSIWRLRCFRHDLAELRARIRTELAGRTPLPRELAQRFRRSNPWRVVLHVWIWSFVLLMLAAQHFVPPESVSPAMILAALGAVGIAWILHFLSRRIDLAQR
jgi:hypothetical protein